MTTIVHRPKRKFIITQISAPIIGLSTCFLISVILIKAGILKLDHSSSVLHLVVFGIAMLITLIGTMSLWGRFLVVIGILTRYEAQGYPYSKPWEKSNVDEDIDHLTRRCS